MADHVTWRISSELCGCGL